MDILVSSNVERQLFELSGRNADLIATWMEQLKAKKTFTIDEETRNKLQSDFKAEAVDSETCLRTIGRITTTSSTPIPPWHTKLLSSFEEKILS